MSSSGGRTALRTTPLFQQFLPLLPRFLPDILRGTGWHKGEKLVTVDLTLTLIV
jgi:hypothetical protein